VDARRAHGDDETVYPSELAVLMHAVLDGDIESPMQLRGDERY